MSSQKERQQKALTLATYVITECGDDSSLPELVAQLLLTLSGKKMPEVKTQLPATTTTTTTSEAKASTSKSGRKGRSKSPRKQVAVKGTTVPSASTSKPPVLRDSLGVSRATWNTRLKESKSKAEATLLLLGEMAEKKDFNPFLLADYYNKRKTLEEHWSKYISIFTTGNKKDPLEYLPESSMTLDEFKNMGFKIHADTQHISLQDKDGVSYKTVPKDVTEKVREALRLLVVLKPAQESDDS